MIECLWNYFVKGRAGIICSPCGWEPDGLSLRQCPQWTCSSYIQEGLLFHEAINLPQKKIALSQPREMLFHRVDTNVSLCTWWVAFLVITGRLSDWHDMEHCQFCLLFNPHWPNLGLSCSSRKSTTHDYWYAGIVPRKGSAYDTDEEPAAVNWIKCPQWPVGSREHPCLLSWGEQGRSTQSQFSTAVSVRRYCSIY